MHEKKLQTNEALGNIPTKQIIQELSNRPDVGSHIEEIELLLELAKKTHKKKFDEKADTPIENFEPKSEIERLPSKSAPFCQTKVFAERDSTDFIQISPPYGIGERDQFWQKNGCDFMTFSNQDPPVPCHEVNFYDGRVVTRLHNSEGLVALIKNQGYRLNRPFDQVIGRHFNQDDIKMAIENGYPWISAFVTQPFPIFALGNENAETLSKHYQHKNPLVLSIIGIEASGAGPSRIIENKVKEQLNSLIDTDLSRGQDLWGSKYLTEASIRTLASSINQWVEGMAKKAYHRPTILIHSPWGTEHASNRAYLNALFGQTFLSLIYPFVNSGIESNSANSKSILTRLPSFSTSPIRAANVMLLSDQEFDIRQKADYGGSQVLNVETTNTNEVSEKISKLITQIAKKPFSQALYYWKKSIREILPTQI